MLTTIPGVVGAGAAEIVKFKADRDYDVYAMGGFAADEAIIALSYGDVALSGLSSITLRRGVASLPYESVYWSGHLILLNGDSLSMAVSHSIVGSKVWFNILLIPVSQAKIIQIAAEKEAKEWPPW